MSADARPQCAVLGAGTMGAQIALSLALGGATVTLWGRREAGLTEARQRAAAAFDALAAEGLADPASRGAVLARITTEDDISAAVAEARFVLEAVAEDLDAKRDVLTRAETACPPDAVLSSTTSALSPTALQTSLARPGRFCVAHYAQPAHLVKLVEVVPGDRTNAETTAFVTALLNDTGKTPVLCPDVPGFLWARIQHAILREFADLVGRGLVSPEACDTIMKQGLAARLPAMGPFEHADLAGLDLINSPGARAVWADLSNVADPADTPVGALFAEGHTGMRSGKGFYDWTVRDAEAFKRDRDAEIVRRIKIQAGGDVVLASSKGH